LNGNHSGFFEEFEVSLKSLLVNAPNDLDLTIHIIGDELAYNALDDVFEKANLVSWTSRRQITIETYNVQPYLIQWQSYITQKMHEANVPIQRIITEVYRHTVGTWFR